MAKALHLNHRTQQSHPMTRLRRSPRFLALDLSGNEDATIEKHQVTSSAVSSARTTHSHSNLDVCKSVEGVFRKKDETRRRSPRLMNSGKNEEAVDGSRKSKPFFDTAEGVLALRRSPRFSCPNAIGIRREVKAVSGKQKDIQVLECDGNWASSESNPEEYLGGGPKISKGARADASINSDGYEKPEKEIGGGEWGNSNLTESTNLHSTLEERRKGNFRVLRWNSGESTGSSGDTENKGIFIYGCENCGRNGGKRLRKCQTLKNSVGIEIPEKVNSKDVIESLRDSVDSAHGKEKLRNALSAPANHSIVYLEMKLGGHEHNGTINSNTARREKGTCRMTHRELEEYSADQVWTDKQEAALRRAYFSEKPTPNFWKKISKMVPGKSAQECFTRIFSNVPTPKQRQPRSRMKGMNFSPLSNSLLASSKVLEPIEPTIGRPKHAKQKQRCNQKTVRHLLSKHHQADRDNEADLFSTFEDSTNSSSQVFSGVKMVLSPHCLPKDTNFPATYNISSSEKDLVSPPVLKRVKNMALHEKYIDRLHTREAKRSRTVSLQIRSFDPEGETKLNGCPKRDVTAAKNALLTEAVDFIRAFQQTQEACTCTDADFASDDEFEEDQFS